MAVLAKRRDNITETEIDGEIVVMRLDDGEFFSITGSGCEIWRLIDGERSRDELVLTLSTQFDAPEPEIAADVDAFLAGLAGAGLLTRA